MKCSSLFLAFLLAALSGCGGGDKSGASPAAMTPSAVAPPVAVAASAAAPAVIGADSDSVAPMASPAALLDGVASAKTIDLDGDGNGDLLWVNERTGQTWGWLMNGVPRG